MFNKSIESNYIGGTCLPQYTSPRLNCGARSYRLLGAIWGHTCASPVYLTENLRVMQFIPKAAICFTKIYVNNILKFNCKLACIRM